MKKIILIVLVLIFLIPCVNVFFYMYQYYEIYEKDTLLSELQENITYWENGDISDLRRKMCGESIVEILETALTLEYTEVSHNETIKILWTNDIDKESRLVYMPESLHMGRTEDILTELQFFVLDGKNYLLCFYDVGYLNFKLYEYQSNEKLISLLESEHYNTKNHYSYYKEHWLKNSMFVSMKKFAPVCLTALIVYVPYLYADKNKISKGTKKILDKIAIAGSVVIVLSIVIILNNLY